LIPLITLPNNNKYPFDHEKQSIFFLLMAILGFPCFALSQERYLSDQIKILKQYDREHLHRIALPMGGIGTGTVALGGLEN